MEKLTSQSYSEAKGIGTDDNFAYQMLRIWFFHNLHLHKSELNIIKFHQY